MLHVLLFILKFIGILILSIIGLVLLLIACILFVPVRYSARVKYVDGLDAKYSVSYLLHCISINGSFDGKNNNLKFKIFGMKFETVKKFLKRFKKEKEDEEDFWNGNVGIENFDENIREIGKVLKKEDETLSKTDFYNAGVNPYEELYKSENPYYKIDEADVAENDEDIIEINDVENENSAKEYIVDKKSAEDSENIISISSEASNQEDEDTEDNTIFGKIRKLIHKIIYRIKEICGKIKRVPKTVKNFVKKIFKTLKNIVNTLKKVRDFIGFLKEDETREALAFTKEEGIKLFKYVRPCVFKGYTKYGTGDPASTAQILGVYYAVTNGRFKKFKIYTDFENKCFETDVTIKGRIRVYFLLLMALRFYRNKNFMSVLDRRRTNG